MFCLSVCAAIRRYPAPPAAAHCPGAGKGSFRGREVPAPAVAYWNQGRPPNRATALHRRPHTSGVNATLRPQHAPSPEGTGFERSPFWHLLGMRVLTERPGYAEVALPIRPELLQVQGVVHGGAISALADSAAAAAFRLMAPHEPISTIELTVTYIAPVKEGRLIARAEILSARRRIFVADIRIADGDENLIAVARAVYRRFSPPRPASTEGVDRSAGGPA